MATSICFETEYSDSSTDNELDEFMTDISDDDEETLPLPVIPFEIPLSRTFSNENSFSMNTPFIDSPPSFTLNDFSPLHANASLFSPCPPRPQSPFFPTQNIKQPQTPKQDNKQVKIIVPTPDFSILKQSQLGNRKLNRTASSSGIIPETPKKRGAAPSRLSHTPAAPKTPARAPIHSPTHFSHELTPKVTENEVVDNHMENFDQLEKIGQGSFSNVYKARCKSDNKWYAIKILKRELAGETQRAKLIQELKIVKQMNHPHVLSYIFCWEQKSIVHLQTEWCAGGSLSHFMTVWQKERNGTYLDESLLWKFLTDIVLGLHHIHSLGIVHHDLKPGNIFVDSENNLKIGDFGLAGPEHSGDSIEGDSRYLAPEVLDDVVSKASDIFSLGATLFELACLIEMPSADEQWNLLREGNVSQLPNFPGYSSEFKFVVDAMMNPQHLLRPSTSQILALPKVIANIESRKLTQDANYMERITIRPNTPGPTPPFISSLREPLQQRNVNLIHRTTRRGKARRNLMNDLEECQNNPPSY